MFGLAQLSDLPAFCIGHAEYADAATGCTVIVAPEGATCGVDVRGGGPATRETDLLKPENMIEAVHAVVLSGGSAFGLEASCGVMDALSERGIGFKLGAACVPIVTGACLFDLLIGQPEHPDKALGRLAAERALAVAEARKNGETVEPLAQGNVGAGCGATVGKLGAPTSAMKAGFGYVALRMGETVVAALVAVNALGHVRNTQGTWLAGTLGPDGKVMDPLAAAAAAFAAAGAQAASTPCENTTLGVILTNAQLTKAQATKVSSMAHDAYARAIKPVHTTNDGDTIFTFASGEAGPQATDVVAVLATEAMQAAIEQAVLNAEGSFGLKAARDLAE